MKISASPEIKNKLVPYILFPMMIGILTGVLIFLFKISSSAVMRWSEHLYGAVREAPVYLPLLVLGALCLGILAALILKAAKECRGGGIPTAVASIRGLIPIRWVQGVFVLFGSALLTYFAGVPLGNEGPSVQMGAAVGEGSSCLAGKNRLAFKRYLMTSGASSGFAIATGAPLTGIMFALEEAHRRFSTAIFMVASISVLFGTVTQRILSFCFGVSPGLFGHAVTQDLPGKYLWAPIIIGVVCGACSLLFTRLYRAIGRLSKIKGGRAPFTLKVVVIFVATAILGFFSTRFIGTGHALIEEILSGKTVWYTILLAFFVRALLMLCANKTGISGGIFVPNLAFGAMVASLVSEGLVALGLLDGAYYAILVVVGMASFLAASSRTPITAVAFAAEALCVSSNILPVILGVTVSYIAAEILDKKSYTETVIDSRAEAARQGKEAVIVYSHMTVQKGAYADGMQMRDILWPPTCAVLSIDRNRSRAVRHGVDELREGDELHLHYQTYDPEQTMQMLTAILGEQPESPKMRSHLGSAEHLVPLD